MPRTNLAVRVAGAVFRIAGEMRRLLAYFDNPHYHMDAFKQDEHNFVSLNFIIREELNTKLTKVTKITHQ